MTKLKVIVFNEAGWLCPINPTQLKALLESMLKSRGVDILNMALYMVRDGDIMPINKTYLSCLGPTNVLSFPSSSNLKNFISPKNINTVENLENILIISVDTLKRECMLFGQNEAEHCVRLMAHGLLHLLGFEHGDEMFALCDKLEAVGMQQLSFEN